MEGALGEGSATHWFDARFNRDVGLELPGCWISTLRAMNVKLHPPPGGSHVPHATVP